jgi:glutathione S-transferase
MRVRWALEEVGQPYDVRLVSFSQMKEPVHLALHPEPAAGGLPFAK